MNAVKQMTWLLGMLVALACSGWYYVSSSTAINRLDEETLSSSPDIIISQLCVMQFDVMGKLANYIRAPEVHHIPNNNTHFFISPRLALSESNQPPWEISSKYAQAVHDGERIVFTQDVLVHQNKGEHNEESTLKTEELVYLPKEKLATSQKAICFEQPGRIVKSAGMKVFLADKQVLLTQAHAIFEPPKNV